MRPRPRLALLLLPVLVLGGCSTDGGAPSASEPPPASTAPPSTPADVTTAPEPSESPEPSEPTDVVFSGAAEADAHTEQGPVMLADVGGDWVEYKAAGGSLTTAGNGTRIGCAFSAEAGADPAAVTSIADGPILQKGAATAYVTSTVIVFQDEAAAVAAVEAFRSPAWSTCRVTMKDAQIPAPAPGAAEEETSWRADPPLDEGRGEGGYEGTVRFQYQVVVDGQQVDANGVEVVSFYRAGAKVLLVAAETVSGEADTPEFWQAFDAELYAGTVAALGRIGA